MVQSGLRLCLRTEGVAHAITIVSKCIYVVGYYFLKLNKLVKKGVAKGECWGSVLCKREVSTLGMLVSLKQQLPQYVSAAANAPAFNKGSVADYSNAILDWWRTNGTSFPAWALAARVVFVISPNSASCERVFALLKNLFGDAAMSALADHLQAGLMLNYKQRQVG